MHYMGPGGSGSGGNMGLDDDHGDDDEDEVIRQRHERVRANNDPQQ